MKSDKNTENFYRLLYGKITDYIQNVGFKTLPRYLSNLVDNITRTIHVKLTETVDYDVINIDHDDSEIAERFAKIKEITSPIRFKDSIDFDIYCEIVFHLADDFIIIFYTDDEEFKKKGEKAYLLLETKLKYKKTWLKLIHTKDL